MSFKTSKRVVRSVTAGLLAAGMLLGGLTAPSAMAGGGSGSGDGGGGSLAADFFWRYKDDASGSWGSASDFSSVEAVFNAAGVTLVNNGGAYNGIDKAKAALEEAKAECESGFNARHPDEAGRADCRVVAVGARVYHLDQKVRRVGYSGRAMVEKPLVCDRWQRSQHVPLQRHTAVPDFHAFH